MKNILFIIYLLVSIDLHGQLFEKNVATYIDGNIFQIQGGNHIMNMTNSFYKLDPLGNVLFNRTFSVLSSFGVTKVLRIDDSKFAFCGRHLLAGCGTTGRLGCQISYIDTSGNFVDTSKYYLFDYECGYMAENYKLHQSGNISITGTGWNCNLCTRKPFIIEVNTQGDVLWSHYFGGYNGSSSFAIETNDTSVIVGMNLDTAGASIVKIDKIGTVQWYKSLWRPRGFISDAVSSHDNGVLIVGLSDSISGMTGPDPYPSGLHANLVLVKLDSQGNIQWSKQYDAGTSMSMYSPRIISTLDSSYIVTASNYQNNYYNSDDILFIKVDQFGNIIFCHKFGNQNFSMYPLGLNLDNNGNIIFSGKSFGFLPGTPWHSIFGKVDSLANGNCMTAPYPIITTNFSILDSSFSMPTVDDSAYSISVSMTDTIPNVFNFYDFCSYTFMVEQPDSENGFVSVQPNPNRGSFNLIMNNWYNGDLVQVSIIDELGKQVYFAEREFQPTVLISDTKLIRGFYLVKVQFGKQQVVRKMIVE